MTFAEKLKELRKQSGLSQEKLAEKLGVSRQAVTKWERDTGVPDIDNIMAISKLFDVSMDELFSNERSEKKERDFLHESVTEYDIDEPKRFDIKLGGAKELVFTGYNGEKIRIHLASNTLSNLQSDFKVKIDDVRKRIDVDVNRKNNVTEAIAKKELYIFVEIPTPYIGKIECAINAEQVKIASIECNSIELDTKTQRIFIDDVVGIVEINCNLDMDIVCSSLSGNVEINQISATSKITIPKESDFSSVAKGIGTSITFEEDGKTVEPFDNPESDNIIELNGIKSELVISR